MNTAFLQCTSVTTSAVLLPLLLCTFGCGGCGHTFPKWDSKGAVRLLCLEAESSYQHLSSIKGFCWHQARLKFGAFGRRPGQGEEQQPFPGAGGSQGRQFSFTQNVTLAIADLSQLTEKKKSWRKCSCDFLILQTNCSALSTSLKLGEIWGSMLMDCFISYYSWWVFCLESPWILKYVNFCAPKSFKWKSSQDSKWNQNWAWTAVLTPVLHVSWLCCRAEVISHFLIQKSQECNQRKHRQWDRWAETTVLSWPVHIVTQQHPAASGEWFYSELHLYLCWHSLSRTPRAAATCNTNSSLQYNPVLALRESPAMQLNLYGSIAGLWPFHTV